MARPKQIVLEPALAALRKHGQPRMAAREGGVSYRWVFDRIRPTVMDESGVQIPNPKLDLELKEAWEQALDDHAERCLDELRTRALEGYEERPILNKEGDVVGHVLKKSDRLLELLVKKYDPSLREKVDITAEPKQAELDRAARAEAPLDLKKLDAAGREALRVVLLQLGDGSIPESLLESIRVDPSSGDDQ